MSLDFYLKPHQMTAARGKRSQSAKRGINPQVPT